jgi:alkanesulfonate monooxygenase SsuD/methylene tetrahydromethanopterin reductase-like flavin-dependent oxidoreductase (luciferase family)
VPLQWPLPLLVGATEPRMLRLAAGYAIVWNHWSVPDGFRKSSQALDAACEREGRDPSTIARSTQALTIVTDSAESEATAAAMAESRHFR